MEGTYDILVVDHDEAVATCIIDTLSSEGYRVLYCLPRALSLDVVELLQPALLITEVHGLDTAPMLALLDQIRRHPSTRDCALLVTSTDRRLLEAQAPQLHALGCATLTKPYNLDSLLNHVAQAFGSTLEREVCR